MPVELSELLNNERWIAVDIGGVVIQVAYRVGSTSLQRQAEMQKRLRQLASEDVDEEAQAQEAGRVFCELVSHWDLLENGSPLPLTLEVVTRRIPGVLVNTVMRAIGEDAEAQQEEKKALKLTSGAGSERRARSDAAHNGIPSSKPVDTWA